MAFYVIYDTHLDKVPKEWRINIGNSAIKEDSVYLLFAEGILPGWKVEDKNVCSTYIKNEDISQAWTIKESIITNNVEKEKVDPDDLYSMYRRLISL